MTGLSYTSITSLDGYFVDSSGRFDWAEPDREVHAFINDLVRPIGTYLCGRRLYEVMAVWDTIDPAGDSPPEIRDFATVWQAADKIVFSRTMAEVTGARTRLERQFDPDAVRQLVETADAPVTVGGAELAAAAFGAGLVEEIHCPSCSSSCLKLVIQKSQSWCSSSTRRTCFSMKRQRCWSSVSNWSFGWCAPRASAFTL